MEKSCPKERTNTLLLIAQFFGMKLKQFVFSFSVFVAVAILASCGNSSNQVEANGDAKLIELNKKIAENPNDIKLYLERAAYLGSINKFNEAYDDVARAKAIDSTLSLIHI